MNFEYQKKQNFSNTNNNYTPQTPKELYSPQNLDEEYDGDFEEYKFYKGKDINIYRLWVNKYSKHITWKDFQVANQHFDINSPAEGQIIKVPKITSQKEEKKKPTVQPKQEKKETKKQETKKQNFSNIKEEKKYEARQDKTRVEKKERFFKVKDGKIVLNNEENNWHPPMVGLKKPKGFFEEIMKSSPVDTELDNLMKKTELTTEEIAKARILIEKIKDDTKKGDYFEDLQYKVPYYNQRDSKAYPSIGGGMCNLSSMAMGLALFGVNNPKTDMQYDDALEKIRIEKKYGDRESTGQMDVARHFGFYFGGIDGDKKKVTDNTYVGPEKQDNFEWFEKNIIPELRKGNSITLGIWSYETTLVLMNGKYISVPKYGHIVHLIGVTDEGLIVNDPYAKANFSGVNYYEVMHSKMNSKEENSVIGKRVLWKYEDLKNSKAVYLAYLRVLKK